MKNLELKEKLELVLRKANWTKEILHIVQESCDDAGVADILAALEFIVNSMSEDAEAAYQSLDPIVKVEQMLEK